jgi:hypothetical protein
VKIVFSREKIISAAHPVRRFLQLGDLFVNLSVNIKLDIELNFGVFPTYLQITGICCNIGKFKRKCFNEIRGFRRFCLKSESVFRLLISITRNRTMSRIRVNYYRPLRFARNCIKRVSSGFQSVAFD